MRGAEAKPVVKAIIETIPEVSWEVKMPLCIQLASASTSGSPSAESFFTAEKAETEPDCE